MAHSNTTSPTDRCATCGARRDEHTEGRTRRGRTAACASFRPRPTTTSNGWTTDTARQFGWSCGFNGMGAAEWTATEHGAGFDEDQAREAFEGFCEGQDDRRAGRS